ncbi:MAG: YceI family protein [Candidatus Kapabacteria bacterium]|nr:YceI family protein [Candidatus Kapabacteria bacterium]
MKTILLATALLAATLGSDVLAGGKTITIINNEKYSNEIEFLSDAPLEKIKGTAKGISGMFTIDQQNLEKTNGSIVVKVNSMKSGNSTRDDHMYSETWLDEKNNPTITFAVKGLKDVQVVNSNGRMVINATAFGDFTLHGVTKPLSAKVVITYVNESEATKKIGNGDFCLIQTNFDVALKDYKVAGKAGIVGSKVGESIKINAQLFGTTAAGY